MARDFALSIDVGFHTHPKTLRFCRLMGSELALGALIKLWSWATEAAPDGGISRYDGADIEWAIGHREGDGRCFRALCDAGFIDHDNYRPMAIHDWMAPGHTGYALVQQRAARDRWRRNKGLPAGPSRKTQEIPRGTSEESPGTPAPSRFTVHGSQENPPPAGAIPRGSAPEQEPPPDVRDPHRPELLFDRARRRGDQITPWTIATWFSFVREAEFPGCLPWAIGKGVEKADSVASICRSDPDSAADLIPAMRLIFAQAKAGVGDKAADVIQDPTYAFGCFCGKFTTLQEAVRGVTPPAPPNAARAGPRGSSPPSKPITYAPLSRAKS